MSDAPTLEYIAKAEAHWSERWALAREVWIKADAFYKGTFDVWTKPEHIEKRSSYRPTVGRDTVDHAVDNQIAIEPTVYRQPVGRDSNAAKADADGIEAGIEAILEDCFKKEMVLPPKAIAKELFLKGYANAEAPMIVEEPGEPEREKGDSDEEWEVRKGVYEAQVSNWNPFRIRVYNPARILLDPQERVPTWGIKRGYWYARDLTKVYRSLKKRDMEAFWDEDTDPFLRYRVADYWDEEWHIVIVSQALSLTGRGNISLASTNGTGAFAQGQIFLEEKNVWGYVPFTHGFAGFGFEPTDSDIDDPQYMAQGLLHPAYMEALRIDAQQKTGVHNALMEAAFGSIGTIEKGPVARAKAKSELKEGAKKEDWWRFDPPNLPAWMFQMMGIHKEDLRFGSYASILTGERPEGTTTVGATAILSSAAAQKFLAPGKQLNFIFSEVAKNMLRWIDVTGKSVTVGGKTITREMIRHFYDVQVEFELLNPVVHLQEKSEARQDFGAGLKSWESYQEVARVRNTTEERRRLWYDMGMKHPIVQEIIAKAVLKGWGVEEIMREIEAEGRRLAGKPALAGGGLVDTRGNPLLAPEPSPMGVPTANPPLPGSPREAAVAAEQLSQPIGEEVMVMAGAKPPRKTRAGRS